MRLDWTHIEDHRTSPKGYESKTGERFGWFVWHIGKTQLRALATEGETTEWEHVSVTVAYKSGKKWVERTPKWEEMCWIKRMFWWPEECVVQYHPAESNYVNNHNHCLHLWRPKDGLLPTPPTICV